ncbi:MAG: hypothetical protein DRN26_00065 [Thermoplasmata archaeon]|nr:MAG: hypothetical protein DRN26_00065 [Thermoplasmata archaeon]
MPHIPTLNCYRMHLRTTNATKTVSNINTITHPVYITVDDGIVYCHATSMAAVARVFPRAECITLVGPAVNLSDVEAVLK